MNSISLRFALYAVSGALLILAFIGGVNYYFLKKELLHDASVKASLIEEHSVHRIENILSTTKMYSKVILKELEEGDYSEAYLEKISRKALKEEFYFYAIGIGFEPGVIYEKAFSPYYHKTGSGTIRHIDMAKIENYHYLKQEWYTLPKGKQKPQWTEPYFDEGGGNILMSTYGAPFYKNNVFAGVMGIDLSLIQLEEIISAVHILDTGYAFLLSKEHKILVHPDVKKIMSQYPYKNIPLRQIIQKKDKWIYFAPVAKTGLILGIVLPENELFASLNKISLISIILAIIGSILLIIIMLFISRRITKPIKEVTRLTQEISHGNFEKRITLPKTKDEIFYLSRSINRMQDSIQNYISDLKNATIKEERIESELDIARSIQMSMLPKDLSENAHIGIAALLKPAKAVGGDFYDYFYIDEEHLCVVVADVSGKGVPAAMFMSVTMSYIRAYATKPDPARIVNRLNNTVSANNDANMFVTLFLAILNVETGVLRYVNAGHTEPYILSKEEGIKVLTSPRNPVVGAFESIDYNTESITMQNFDKLFLYTDGVTEAFSKEDILFDTQRLEEVLDSVIALPAQQCIDVVEKSVTEFTEGCEQSDDITMLLIAKK